MEKYQILLKLTGFLEASYIIEFLNSSFANGFSTLKTIMSMNTQRNLELQMSSVNYNK